MDKLCDFYDQIYDKHGLMGASDICDAPLSIQINLLNKCYQRCIGCRKYEWEDIQLPLKTITSILEDIEEGTVVYSGGEPLLHPDINKILKASCKHDVKFGVLTSALYPQTVDLEFLIKNSSFLSISVDGATPETFKKTRGVDCLNKVIQNIINFVELKNKLKSNCRIRINSTISNLNIHEMPQIFKLAETIGIDCNFFPIHTWKDLELTDTTKIFNDSIVETFKLSLNSSITSNIKDFKDLLNRKTPKHCIAPHVHCFIDANGDVLPCCRLANDNGEYKRDANYVMGNVLKTDLHTIWNSERFHKFKESICFNPKYPECKECDRYQTINNDFTYWINNKRIFL
jgi:radical SAM protein with 4Fe4S-binding SPASM domain